MRNWTVRKRIIYGFSAVILIMIVLSGFAYIRLAFIKSEANRITTRYIPGLYFLGQLEATSNANFALTHKLVISEDAKQKQVYLAGIQDNRAKITNLYTLYEATIGDGETRRYFDAMVSARGRYLGPSRALMSASQNSRDKAVLSPLLDQLTQTHQDYLNVIQENVEHNKQNVDSAGTRIRDLVGGAQNSLLLGLLIGFFLASTSVYLLVRAINQPLRQLVAAFNVIRQGDFSQSLTLVRQDEFGMLAEGLNLMRTALASLIGQVQRSGIQVGTSTTEIAASFKQQQTTASEIAATTREVGATAKEISATSKELVKTMKDVTEVAERTAMLAGSGQTDLARMDATIRQITEASGSISSRLAVVSEKAGNITKVVTTIAKVADQTNLLSLNASIEAEKAGEYGRGFAVVATEIRRLADQTAISTHDIEQIVREMHSAVSAGVMGMDKFSEEVRRGVEVVGHVSSQLTQIIQQVQALTPNFESVNEGMQSQSQGAQQISDALIQLSDGVDQTVESLRQSTLAIGQLNEAAHGLQVAVSRFKLEA
ncbi:MAG: methyl-accepting chemotaxis protein [Terriglobia bacterium]